MKRLRRYFLLAAVLGSVTLSGYAQTETEEDSRFPGLPYFSYGSGLGWTTPDSTYQMNIRFRIQNRVTYSDYENSEPAVEAVVRRLRLRFDGYVKDPRFLYAIQLSFAPGDVGTLSEGDNINIIRDAMLYYRPNRHWNIGFGQTKLPGNRQRVNSSGALQLTDRSINNAIFTIDRDFGLQVYYLDESQERFSFNIKTAVSTGNGRNWTQNPDHYLAYTGRLELMPFGSFQRNGMFFEGDLVREHTPKLLLGGTYHFNNKAQRTRGQLGDPLFEQRDLTSILLDAMLKFRGLAIQSAWMTRMTDNPVTVSQDPISENRFVFAGEGMDHQISYIFPIEVELIGRYSIQTPTSSLANRIPEREQFSVGVTKYIWEHSLKLQLEGTYDKRTFSNNSTNNGYYVRFQVELGI
jgi:phosphate-selective porin OprO and OprP